MKHITDHNAPLQGEQLIEQKARARDRERILTAQLDKCRQTIESLTTSGADFAAGRAQQGPHMPGQRRAASSHGPIQRPATAESGGYGREAWIER